MAGPESILGRRADWAFLYAPTVVVVVLAAASLREPVVAWLVLVPLAAFPGLAHVLSTSMLYFDAQNRSVFAHKRAIFYDAPLGLFLAAAAFLWWMPSGPAYTLLLLIAIWHNTRQSLGILNLTRRTGGVHESTRPAEHAFVWASNLACLAFAAAPAFPTAALSPIRGVAGVVLACATAGLVASTLRAPIPRHGGAHLAFLLVSASLAWPLLAIGDGLLAWALMSLPHQVQYLGILWTAQRRRYAGDAPAPGAHPILLRLVHDGALFCSVLAAAAGLALALDLAPAGTLQRIGSSLVLGATLSHYWLDSFVWRWRDPAMRDLLLSPLTRPQRAAA